MDVNGSIAEKSIVSYTQVVVIRHQMGCERVAKINKQCSILNIHYRFASKIATHNHKRPIQQ